MKKYILLIFLFLFPINAKALVNYDITDYLIDASITEEGDINIKELIVLDGKFHGYIRDIVYKNSALQTNGDFNNNDIYNAKGLKNVKVYAKELEQEVSFQTFDELFYPLKKVYYESEAQNKDYVEQSITNGKSYKMYYEGQNTSIAYLLTYTIEKAVVIHKDIAELYWTFIGNDFDDEIHNLQIKVHLPGKDDDYRLWAHGDITGIAEKIDDESLLATMKSLPKNSPVDLRIAFNKDLITNQTYLNKTNEEALPKILEVETKRAELTENEIRKAKIIYNIMATVSTIFGLILIGWWIYVYIKYDKEYKSDFNAQYYREFIEDYSVEVIDYLMKGTITSNAMSASILNLIYKKNIKVEQLKNKNEYQFTLINKENLTNNEELLCDFLFETVGNNNTFTTKQLDTYAKGSSTYNYFQTKYNSWQNCVRKEAENCHFYEKNGIPIVSGIFFLLIALLISTIIYYYHVDYFLGYIIFPASLIYLLYALMIKKRTKKGNEDYRRWNAFKRFLKDFGSFETKELPQIVLWEKYLVYAAVFGLTKEVSKAMNTKIAEYKDLDYNYFIDFHIASHVSSAITSSVNSANVASQRNGVGSNGQGFGGGFSSGSGFGGGGGGGRGF